MSEERNVRVRFAPSPTGLLHPGGARTALFNYLFARFHGGKIILRVEDTDLARSSPEFEEKQLEDLRWLGLSFDEGPFRQSERGEVYGRALDLLSEKGLTCEAKDEAGRVATYFRPPARSGSFSDALRGEVSFSKIPDFVIRKSDGTPSYNFAAAVDDADMNITRVIRGEEHLPNTARQTLLYRALGEAEPAFVHLGVILGPDGKKLSKRHGAASIAEFRRIGYLPEALVNHLALLGWSHPEGREFFGSLEELVSGWDPDRLGASPSTFDPDRLLGLNAEHVRALDLDELEERISPFLDEPLPAGREKVAVEAIREDMKIFSEAPEILRAITGVVDPEKYASELPESSLEVFAHAAASLEEHEDLDLEGAREFVKKLRSWAKEKNIKTRDLLHPLRLALTGRDRGPEMAYLFAVLGQEESKRRIEAAREARLEI
ncbi:MAG: glutamate--tRNA ligase [Rubrobacteraceae bacterium]